MKLTTISGIIGTLILCMILVLFIFQTKEVKTMVAAISICVVLIEGIILIIYTIWKDD